MDSRTQYNSYTVEDVFQDFKGRRAGLIKALTTDADDLYNQCDPDKENLCLYGFPDEEWKVTLPAENIPSELPEPSLGINFARSGMRKTDWLSLVATHSDSWLFGVASYYGYGFNKSDRERLFSMINELPTILEVVDAAEVVTDAAKKQVEEKSKSNSIAAPESQVKELEEEDDESILCEVCSMHYGQDTFWIFCDFCEHWYHGKCVEVTPDMADVINEYKCPFCRIKFD
ncbi:hypothetical protein P8452_73881 [Trifolium repens]|nr:hypothetical protein P8452_73881 [Trifolium repens]